MNIIIESVKETEGYFQFDIAIYFTKGRSAFSALPPRVVNYHTTASGSADEATRQALAQARQFAEAYESANAKGTP